jgi:microcin C transport system substrate-binding protein
MKRRELFAAGFGLVPFAAAGNSPWGSSRLGVIRTHALSLLGEPALPADFPHFPWANPDAPKGGEVALTALGSFDSFNPFILRGTPAVGSPNSTTAC